MRNLIRFGILLSFFAFMGLNSALAAPKTIKTIAGYWQYTDDHTQRPTGILKIWEQNGKFFGKIVENYAPNPNEKAHTSPKIGTVVLKNMLWRGKIFKGGSILDTISGKSFRCRMKLIDGGARVQVSKYGTAAQQGQMQVWIRMKPITKKIHGRA